MELTKQEKLELRRLINKLLDDGTGEVGEDAIQKDTNLEIIVSKYLIKLGVAAASLMGYRYLLTGIMMAVKDKSLLDQVNKVLYNKIAEELGTTPTRVERTIRHAIETSWSKCNSKVKEEIFRFTVNSDKGKPKNKEFIALLVDRCRMEYIQ